MISPPAVARHGGPSGRLLRAVRSPARRDILGQTLKKPQKARIADAHEKSLFSRALLSVSLGKNRRFRYCLV
jgi:hypothetical protein